MSGAFIIDGEDIAVNTSITPAAATPLRQSGGVPPSPSKQLSGRAVWVIKITHNGDLDCFSAVKIEHFAGVEEGTPLEVPHSRGTVVKAVERSLAGVLCVTMTSRSRYVIVPI